MIMMSILCCFSIIIYHINISYIVSIIGYVISRYCLRNFLPTTERITFSFWCTRQHNSGAIFERIFFQDKKGESTAKNLCPIILSQACNKKIGQRLFENWTKVFSAVSLEIFSRLYNNVLALDQSFVIVKRLPAQEGQGVRR